MIGQRSAQEAGFVGLWGASNIANALDLELGQAGAHISTRSSTTTDLCTIQTYKEKNNRKQITLNFSPNWPLLPGVEKQIQCFSSPSCCALYDNLGAMWPCCITSPKSLLYIYTIMYRPIRIVEASNS